MSEFDGILSDNELRDLLKQYMLAEEENNVMTEKMIEMESKIAFGAAPLVALAVPHETEMIGKLSKSFAGKSGFLAWTIGLGVTAAVSVGVYQFTGHTPSEKNPGVPIEQKENIPTEKTAPVMPESPFEPANHTAVFAPQKDTAPQQVLCLAANEKEPDPQDVFVSPPPFTYVHSAVNTPTYTPAPPVTFIMPDTNQRVSKGSTSTSIDTSFARVKRLQIDGGLSNIVVTKRASPSVHLVGQIKVEAKGLAKKPDYYIRHEQKGDVLKIWLEQSKNNTWMLGSLNVDINMYIEVPSGTDIDLTSTSGNVEISDLDGRVCNINSNYGNVRATNINTAFNITAQSGNVSLNNCNGGVNISNAYGNLTVEAHKGNLKTRLSAGNVKINGLVADQVDIMNSYGSISMSNVTAPVMNFDISSGAMVLENIQGNVNIRSAYGDQRIHSLLGNFNCSTSSGNLKLEEITGDIRVKSTYGDINASSCKGNIVVQSESGNIKGKKISVDKGLDLSATYGDIFMQLENPLDELSFDLQAVSGDLNVKKGGTNVNGEKGKLQLQKGKILIKGNTKSGSQLYE